MLDFFLGLGIMPPVDFATFPAIFLLISASGGVAWLTASAAIWALKRSHYRLECDIADLQNSVLIEIKKRAGSESAKSRKQDAELLAQLQNGKPTPTANQPWWQQYVHPDLKGN